jgi:hypothetical protein
MRPFGMGERRFTRCLPVGAPLWKMMIRHGCEALTAVGQGSAAFRARNFR